MGIKLRWFLLSVALHSLVLLRLIHSNVSPEITSIDVSYQNTIPVNPTKTRQKIGKFSDLHRFFPKLDYESINRGKSKPTEYAIRGSQDTDSLSQVRFYTYVVRIQQQLSQHWRPSVKAKIEELQIKGQHWLTTVTTRCAVVLDEHGAVLSVRVVESSGVKELDDTAMQSFLAAGSFPNPPKDLVNPEHQINVLWEFVVAPNTGPTRRRKRIPTF